MTASRSCSAAWRAPWTPTIRGATRRRRLDATSVDDWLRSVGATPAVRRTMVALAPEPVHRPAAALVAARGAAQAGRRRRDRVLRRRRWESDRVEEGSATVALRMAEELGDRVRLAEPVRRVAVVAGRRRRHGRGRRGAAGERRRVRAAGRPAARRRARRPRSRARALLAGPAQLPRRQGRDRLRAPVLARPRAQRPVHERALLRLHVAAARGRPLGAGAARAPGRLRRRAARRQPRDGAARDRRAVRRRGARRRSPTSRGCGGSTRTRAATSPPGRRATSCAVGPRHGTHAPPIWFCGSDQWVAGYMEGAVRTGRAAAASLLASR